VFALAAQDFEVFCYFEKWRTEAEIGTPAKHMYDKPVMSTAGKAKTLTGMWRQDDGFMNA
jgi:hypothetical protein